MCALVVLNIFAVLIVTYANNKNSSGSNHSNYRYAAPETWPNEMICCLNGKLTLFDYAKAREKKRTGETSSSGGLDLMSGPAMYNAYLICHNVQVSPRSSVENKRLLEFF
jgi:hypothetical protein